MQKPPVICVCGSTKFKDIYLEIHKALTLSGVIYVSVGWFGHADDMPSEEKKVQLDALHFAKIDLADAILIATDETGYVGESTK